MTSFDEDFEGGFIDYSVVKRLQSFGADKLCYVALDFEQEMATAAALSSLEKDSKGGWFIYLFSGVK